MAANVNFSINRNNRARENIPTSDDLKNWFNEGSNKNLFFQGLLKISYMKLQTYKKEFINLREKTRALKSQMAENPTRDILEYEEYATGGPIKLKIAETMIRSYSELYSSTVGTNDIRVAATEKIIRNILTRMKIFLGEFDMNDRTKCKNLLETTDVLQENIHWLDINKAIGINSIGDKKQVFVGKPATRGGYNIYYRNENGTDIQDNIYMDYFPGRMYFITNNGEMGAIIKNIRTGAITYGEFRNGFESNKQYNNEDIILFDPSNKEYYICIQDHRSGNEINMKYWQKIPIHRTGGGRAPQLGFFPPPQTVNFMDTVYKDKNRNLIVEKILEVAEEINALYRSEDYREIRNNIFSFITNIANNPISIATGMINISITGPAGSGKTTMARKIAKWLDVIGVFNGDSCYTGNEQLIFEEASRSNFMGQYIGQTTPKTENYLLGNLEKTIFIDEAYTLSGCTLDSNKKLKVDQYAQEFIGVFLAHLTSFKGRCCIIVAGYMDKMLSCFFAMNEGLDRRFPIKIDLPLYTTDDLHNILLANIINKNRPSRDTDEVYNNKRLHYISMKPFLMMLHASMTNITHTATDMLRKYLLCFDMANRQDPEGFPSIDKIYSNTITSHVLISLLDTPLRRAILRRWFFKEVFNFEDQNLSFLPAQAGDMENIVTFIFSSKIEKETDKAKTESGVISIADIKRVFNKFFHSKNYQFMFDTIKTRDNTRQFFEIINKSKTEEEIKSEYVRIYDILPKKISDPPLPQNAATTFLNVINGQKSLLQLYNHIMIMANRIDYTNQIRGIYNEKAPAILDSIMTKLRKDPDSLPTDINKDVFIQEYNKFFKRESTLQGNVYSPRNAPTISISYQSDTYTDGEVAIPVLQPGADYYNIRTSEGKSHLITDYGIIIRN